MLHFVEINGYNAGDLLTNKKVNKSRRFISKELSNLLDGYKKEKIKFERFESGIDNAIKRAKALPSKNLDLLDKLGCSVYLLVEKLIAD